jgi:hypothetical protein
VLAAAEFYESRRPRWGRRFMERFSQGLRSIRPMPAKYRLIDGPFHCYMMVQFPYGIVYSFDDKTIRIVAVIDHSRDPQYWLDRLKNLPS